MSETAASEFPVHEFKTHRRTITETDIVNFVNLTAFHAVVTTDGELPEPLLRSITFTGPDGKQHGHSYSAGNRR